MSRRVALVLVFGVFFLGATAIAQGPCPAGSTRLACVIPLEYGVGGGGQPFSGAGLFKDPEHGQTCCPWLRLHQEYFSHLILL